ncbi:MAG TPA: Crp/Fnr family transcriptional regulator [Armatimonadota bacterium]|jgi:CRP-like cAMP-binding protein
MERFGPAVLVPLTPEEVQKALAAHPFVQGMEPAQLKLMSDIVGYEHFDAGKRIFQEGEAADRLYLVICGTVALEVFNLNQGTIPIQTVGAGEVLGSSWFVPPYRWKFDAKAEKPTETLVFNTDLLQEMFAKDNAFGFEFMKRMAMIVDQRITAAKEQLLDMYAYRK